MNRIGSPVRALFILLIAMLGACASKDLPKEPPPLKDMEEPLTLATEPADEAARAALPKGGFTGIYVKDARRSLDELDQDTGGVVVDKVVENSPADRAGVRSGDVIVTAAAGTATPAPVRWPSEWKKLELDAKGGDVLHLSLERDGAATACDVTVEDRVRTPDRSESKRYRETRRIGVTLRTATEVEARAAGLGPGAGAVVVGLSQKSPMRAAGMTFGDLITHVNDEPLADPSLLIDAASKGEAGDPMKIRYVRDRAAADAVVTLSERESSMEGFSIPLLMKVQSKGEESEFSLLSGLLGYESTAAAWKFRLLWLLSFDGGDNDTLEEVKP